MIAENMYLAKFIARAGVCARRKAVPLIQAGMVKINGAVRLDPTYVVQICDVVECCGQQIELPQELCYLLLNKPAGYLTAVSDPYGRKTVMECLKGAYRGRIYPVGRLDCATTGLLLFTNDGTIAQRLAHPRFEVSKRYVARLDRPFEDKHFSLLQGGLVLEDGPIEVDRVSFPVDGQRDVVSVVIHSGRNRIVRRMFKHLGYHVAELDRVEYAGLKKADLKLGGWRRLTAGELGRLKGLCAEASLSKPLA